MSPAQYRDGLAGNEGQEQANRTADVKWPRVQPFGPRILVKPDAGIAFSWTTGEPGNMPAEGVVLAVGAPGKADGQEAAERSDVAALAVGDRVLFGQSAGALTCVDGEFYVILHLNEVLATVSGEPLNAGGHEWQPSKAMDMIRRDHGLTRRQMIEIAPVPDATGYVGPEADIPLQ